MIGTIWPWARVARQGRTFLWLAIVLISASGLITGLVVRSFSHGTGGATPIGVSGSPTATLPIAGTITPTLAPAVTTPQQFAILLEVTTPTAHGETMTIVAHAVVASKYDSTNGLPVGPTRPAQGITCQLTFTPAGGIAPPSAQMTDVSGTAAFAVPIPTTTVPGNYMVHVHAAWGTSVFAANREVQVKIT
ncbi:MAG: hypothetical protein H0X24_17465 [Ktedonobacterales bacterium]|nr:hypothetical protein [Ktedonobacterales bacterium]